MTAKESTGRTLTGSLLAALVLAWFCLVQPAAGQGPLTSEAPMISGGGAMAGGVSVAGAAPGPLGANPPVPLGPPVVSTTFDGFGFDDNVVENGGQGQGDAGTT